MILLKPNLRRLIFYQLRNCVILSFFFFSCSQEVTNSPPIIDRLIIPTEVSAGGQIDLHVIARDPEGDPLSYTWAISQGQIVESSSRTVAWTVPDQPGSFTITVFISDGISEPTTRSKQVVVKAPNRPPKITKLVIPKKATAGQVVQLSVLAIDPNEDPLIFTWKMDETILAEGPTAEIDWKVPVQEGEVVIQVSVSDRIALVVQDSSIVTITRSLLIVPGLKAGGITLGDSFEKIKQIYGEPNMFEPVDDLFFFAFWQPDQGVSGFINGETKTVTATFVQSPNQAKTIAGNGVDSNLANVEKEFGPVEDIRNNLEHWYWTKGIEFDIDDQQVDQIFIFRPVLNFGQPQPLGAPILNNDPIGYSPMYYKWLHQRLVP